MLMREKDGPAEFFFALWYPALAPYDSLQMPNPYLEDVPSADSRRLFSIGWKNPRVTELYTTCTHILEHGAQWQSR